MTVESISRQKTGLQSKDNPFEFILSTEDADRDNDIIVQSGWDLKEFKKNPIALFQHDKNSPIGTWEKVRVEGKRLVGRLKLAEKGTSQLVDEVRSLVEQGILRAISVGFISADYEPLDPSDPWAGYKFKKSTLLEASLVSVPANPNALALVKGLGISRETRELVFGKDSLSAVKSKAKQSRSLSAASRTHGTKGSPMKLGDKIVAANEKLEELRESVTDIVKAAEDDGRDLNEEETVQIEALEGEIEAAEDSLKGLKSAERALAKRAEMKSTSKAGIVPATTAIKEKPGALLIKNATCHLLAHIKKTTVENIVTERYSHDPRVAEITKSDTTSANTTRTGWAAELVETDLAGFLEDLRPISIYPTLSAAGTSIPFGGANQVTIPKRSGTGNVAGSFIGEDATIPVQMDNYGSNTFQRHKMAVITTFTKELERVSTPQIESLLRDAIRDDTADRIDALLMDPTMAAVANLRPGSPWNGAATQASAGTTLDNILTDIRFLLDTLSSANAGRNPYIIMNPARLTGLSMLTNANGSFVFRDEIAQGRLMGVPLIVSTNCPAANVYIIDAADFGTAFGTPEFDVSDTATLVMVNDDGTDPSMYHNTTEAPDVDVAGSAKVSDAAGITGGPAVVKSLFQHWAIGLRMVMPITWGMFRTGTVAYVTGVAW